MRPAAAQAARRVPRFPRALRFVLLALFLLAWPGTVLAQAGPASLSCRRQCETQTRSDMPRELQANAFSVHNE